jgi:hypothetical protein
MALANGINLLTPSAGHILIGIERNRAEGGKKRGRFTVL